MSSDSFRRYTNLPVILNVLYKKELTLLDPRSWDDKNDSYFMEIYRERSKLKSVLAICFAEAPETYHHWKVFSGDSSGVCAIFDKEKLLKCFNSEEFESRDVKYLEISELKNYQGGVWDLPFIKRFPFINENEFRIIYKDRNKKIFSKSVPVPISCILEIVINPWMPSSVFDSVKSVIHKIEGCHNIRIKKTTLVENEKWKRFGDKVSNKNIPE